MCVCVCECVLSVSKSNKPRRKRTDPCHVTKIPTHVDTLPYVLSIFTLVPLLLLLLLPLPLVCYVFALADFPLSRLQPQCKREREMRTLRMPVDDYSVSEGAWWVIKALAAEPSTPAESLSAESAPPRIVALRRRLVSHAMTSSWPRGHRTHRTKAGCAPTSIWGQLALATCRPPPAALPLTARIYLLAASCLPHATEISCMRPRPRPRPHRCGGEFYWLALQAVSAAICSECQATVENTILSQLIHTFLSDYTSVLIPSADLFLLTPKLSFQFQRGSSWKAGMRERAGESLSTHTVKNAIN